MEAPAPMTNHPSLDRAATLVRGSLTDLSPFTVRLPKPARATALGDAKPDAPPLPETSITFTIKRCGAPMPFVGDVRRQCAWYQWFVALDDYGRHIAGDSEIVWVENVT